MPQFSYEAQDKFGVQVFGAIDAVDQAEVEARLSHQQLQLVRLTEVGLTSTTLRSGKLLDRLFELRIGEHLREAVLTDIPSHIAVRSVAAEMGRHPSVDICSWGIGIGIAILALLLVLQQLLSIPMAIVLVFGTVVVGLLALRVFLKWWCESRPRSMLIRIAEQLEAGGRVSDVLRHRVPSTLQPVMASEITEEQKAEVTSSVVSQISAIELAKQQLTARMFGPMFLVSTSVLGGYGLFAYVMPMFTSIFESFDTDLPWLTDQFVWISKTIVGFGFTGLIVLCVLLAIANVVMVTMIKSDVGLNLLSRIPLIGLPFRWLILSQIADVFSSMIRSGCDYGQSTIAATQVSHRQSIRSYGKSVAQALQEGRKLREAPAALQGLPFTLVFVDSPQTDQQQRRSAIAVTFEHLSQIFRQTSQSQAHMLIHAFHTFAVVFICFCLGLSMSVVFLPLLRFLNDLA